MADRRGLAGQDRLIESKIGRRYERPVRDQLIAGLHEHDVVNDEFFKRQRSGAAVALHRRGGRDQQREAIERPLRAHLLNDPDRRVRHDDAEEQRVARVTEDQGDGPEPGEDQVEHREDVGPDDAGVRAARPGSPHPACGRQAPRGLGLANPTVARSRAGSVAGTFRRAYG